MTLIKSLLLGSAAGVVAVSAAQAADLPTRKGPVAAEYVRVCSITVAGAPIVGFVLPGSDTCFKISGYITGQIEGGNLKNGNTVSYITNALPAPAPAQTSTQAISGTFARDSIGYTTRLNLAGDAVSNTAYGPLVGHFEIQIDHGSGFDTTGGGASGSAAYVNRAYVTWAGLTAGRANSFFSTRDGGLAWANFFSPDRNGSNQPDLLAYTASFGGGFAASISLENPTGNGGNLTSSGGGAVSGGGVSTGYLGSATQGGMRVPDIVGALDVKQAWGSAHLAGVAHEVRAASLLDATTIDKWGFAVDGGLIFNIPNLAGSAIGVTGAWSRNATWYSGIPDGMWGEPLEQVNGNGQGMPIADAFSNGNGTWATPTAWSVTGWAQFAATPTVTLGVEGSYGQINWTGQLPVSMLSNSRSFIVGGVAHYDPVKNLDFEFELLYQNSTTTQPTGYFTTAACTNAVGSCTTAWQSKSDGFAARFEVTRNF
jgi:hypothetical protein